MTKSHVMRALRLFSFEEMLRLAKGKWTKAAIKKAAGEELVVWDDPPEHNEDARPDSSSNVLPLRKEGVPLREVEPMPDPALAGKNPEQEKSDLLSTELLIWQRELSREHGNHRSKEEVFKGYNKSTEVYMVKTTDIEGKEKIRFASTKGVLVNKKQA